MPTQGTTSNSTAVVPFQFVSIHVPTQGTTRLKKPQLRPWRLFQSTCPHGARQNITTSEAGADVVSIHVPTRGTTPGTFQWSWGHIWGFNPRAHTGHDALRRKTVLLCSGFNPRAHTGHDEICKNGKWICNRFNPRAHTGHDIGLLLA